MKTMTRLAALAIVSAAATACEDLNIAGSDNCYGNPRTEKRVHTYDTRGQLSRLEIYENGAPAVVFRYEYDRAGRRVESRRYLPTALEKPMMLERLTLDAEGRLLRSEHLSPVGGVLIEITRDERGRPVHSEVHETSPSDEVAHDVYVSVTNAVDPNPLEGEGEEYLQPAPGEVATVIHPFSAGGVAETRFDLPPELQPLLWSPESLDIVWSDTSSAFVFGVDGADLDADGEVDGYVYQVVTATESTREDRWDFDGDGAVDRRRLVTMGAGGEVVESTSWDETATPPRVEEHLVSGSDEVVVTTPEKTTTIAHEDGRPALRTDDLGADGTIDRRTTYSYDDEGRLTREVLDESDDGHDDVTWTYTYDDAGRLVQKDMHNWFSEVCDTP